MFITPKAKPTGVFARNPRDLYTRREKTTGLRSKKSARSLNGRLIDDVYSGIIDNVKIRDVLKMLMYFCSSKLATKFLTIEVKAKTMEPMQEK